MRTPNSVNPQITDVSFEFFINIRLIIINPGRIMNSDTRGRGLIVIIINLDMNYSEGVRC